MCGIAGVLLSKTANDPRRLAAVQRMTDALRHRGPDAEGVWLDREAGIALGHRRLAIHDLSDAGSQPMLSHTGNLVVSFNGEVYNFADLRADLERSGHRFSGTSDTEVMLAAIESLGLEAALRRFAGMFALGLWSRRDRALHLIRDRMGKKPLYVTIVDGALVFASELRAIRTFPGFRPMIDTNAVATMLRLGWIPDWTCIWRNVLKLPPGAILSLRGEDLDRLDIEGLRRRIGRWWSLCDLVGAAHTQPLDLTVKEMESELDRLLRIAVRERMAADVPLGAFLSGGIDSSTVVALMQAQSQRPVRTYTIGFGEAGYDEATDAARVARHLGTEHTEFRLSPAAALDIIPELPRVWDEPFADESQIPTLLVSQLARQHVTVVLSGDGGDECFGGYTRHVMMARLAPMLGLPFGLRKNLGKAILMLSPGVWDEVFRVVLASARSRSKLNGESLHRLASVLDAPDVPEMYERLTGCPEATTPGLVRLNTEAVPNLSDPVSRMCYFDMSCYLPGDILVKLDRATMSIGLEARCPLLDHRIVEFAWRVPVGAKVRAGKGKWLLRQVLGRYVPSELYDRPKRGFDVPIAAWLRGPLRDWAEALLAEPRLRREGLLDVGRVRACWQEHQSRRRDRARELWAILMLQAWLEQSNHADLPATAGAFEAALACA